MLPYGRRSLGLPTILPASRESWARRLLSRLSSGNNEGIVPPKEGAFKMAKFPAAIGRGFLAMRIPDESIDELKRFKTALRSPKRDANRALELVDEQLWCTNGVDALIRK